MRGSRLAITGFGLLSPVGHHAWMSAASIRAGIKRFAEVDDEWVAEDREGVTMGPATVARMPFHDDKPRVDRAVACLSDVFREAACLSGLNGAMSDALWYLDCFAGCKGPNSTAAIETRLRRAIPELAGAPVLVNEGRVDACQTVVFERLIQAAEKLLAGVRRIAVVGAVDSLCRQPTLGQLNAAGRLKAADHPYGLVPGEAAGAVILETERHARARNARVYAWLQAWGRAVEPVPWITGEPSQARGLTEAFYQALGDDTRVDLVISDLNGERPRALEWGLTETRVFDAQAPASRRLWHPAVNVGDCGGAMGAVQLVSGVVALAFGYAGTRSVALAASDDAGERRVLVLESADRVSFEAVRPLIEKREKRRMENAR